MGNSIYLNLSFGRTGTGIFILAALLFAPFMDAGAQENRSRSLSVSTGLTHVRIMDRLYSPLQFSSSDMPVHFAFVLERPRSRHSLNLAYSKTDLTNSLSRGGLNPEHIINSLFLNLEYSYLRKTALFENIRTRLMAGGTWNNYFSFREHFFAVNKTETGGEFFSSLNLSVATDTRLFEYYTLNYSLSVPVAAYVIGRYRVPKEFDENIYRDLLADGEISAGSFVKSGEFLWIGDFIDVQSKARLNYSFSRLIDLFLGYQFRFYRFSNPQELELGNSRYLMGVNVNF